MTGAIKGIDEIVREHPFFAGLDKRIADLVCGCAKNAHFQAGDYLFHEGGSAHEFYLLREGRVALQINDPARGPILFQTLQPDEIVGVSWLIPPYRWDYDAKALDYTRAIAMDADCLREKSEADHDLGYEMMKRFVPILVQRLQSTRLQILDVYGAAN